MMRHIIKGVIISVVYILSFFGQNNDRYYENFDAVKIAPPNIQLYEYVIRYSPIYGTNAKYVFRAAKNETSYNGPNDFTYTPYIDRLRISSANARGVLQIKTSTANGVTKGKKLTDHELEYDIEKNVIASLKHQRYLFKIYRDWNKVYSVYNQGWHGADSINQYAHKITR